MRFKLALIYLPILLLSLNAIAPAVYAQTDPNDVKAVLIYKLTKFVTWPHADNQTINLCHYDNSPFAKSIKALERKKVGDLSLTVIKLNRQKLQLSRCDILLIPQTSARQLYKIIATASYHNILTISDIENFAVSGGMIELAQKNRKIHFKVNLKRLKSNNINLHSSFLGLSTIVEGDGND